jgi:putative spermidine/putrescine transport system ATP-binding protein
VIADAIFEGERVVYEVRVPALDDAMLRVFDHDPAGHSQYDSGTAVYVGWNARDLRVYSV